MAKILISSIGTLGDINPALALGKKLKALGHDVGFASCAFYEKAAREAGLGFHRIRPEYNPKDEELCRAIMHPLKTLLNIHKLILTEDQLEMSYQDFIKISGDYDLVMANIFSYASKAACLKINKPWVGLHLSPLCYFSDRDPPALYPFTSFLKLPVFVRGIFFRLLFRVMFKLADFWGKNIYELYKKHELPGPGSTVLEAPFSKTLNLALFSVSFAEVEKEKRGPTVQLGFLDYSGEGQSELSAEIKNFLTKGEAPIFFTFGSTSGSVDEDLLLRPILAYLKESKQRAIVSVSASFKKKNQVSSNDQLLFCEFVPYLIAMPKMKMVIHQGGIGTTSLAMSAGIPQLILPDCTDQYDNAFRATRLGVARSLPRKKLTKYKLERELALILNEESYFSEAKKLQAKLRAETQNNNQEKKLKAAIELALLNNRHGES